MAQLAIAVLVAALATLALSAPVDERVVVTPTTKIVDEGEETVISFSLTEPIICSSDFFDCRVLLLLTNTRPDEIVLSQCHVEWTPEDWETTKTVVVSGVEDFVADGEKTFVLVTESLQSHAEFYANYNPADIEVHTRSYEPAQCRSWTDPNFLSFDGKRFTFNNAGTYLLWGAPVRDWEVQTRVTSNRNCGVAVREGCDLVVLDQCSSRGLVIYSDYKNPVTRRLRVEQERGTNNYIISSAISGASVRVVARIRINVANTHRCGWSGCRTITKTSRTEWLDVYATAPGADFGFIDRGDAQNSEPRTVGLCGSYDNNRGNDPVSASQVHSSKDFFRMRKLSSSCTPQSSRYDVHVDHAKCDYVPKIVQRPVLRNPDVEELTDLLKVIAPREDDPRAAYDFELDDPTSPHHTIERLAEIHDLCTTAIFNSPTAATCLEVGADLDNFVQSCVEDLQRQDDQELIDGSVESMKEECEFLAASNLTLFDRDESGQLVPGELQRTLVAILCPNDCTFNGRCDNGTCICEEGWTGDDCNTNVDFVPPINGLFPHNCDINGDCPREIVVMTEQLLATKPLVCDINGERTTGRFINSVQMTCQLPAVNVTGAEEEVLYVSISRDGEDFTPALPFVFYDATCKQCAEDGECTTLDTSCVIGNKCVVAGFKSEDNPCLACQPAVSQTAFTTSYDSEQCGPQFVDKLAHANVREGAEAGEALLMVSVANEFVDEEYTLTASSDVVSVNVVSSTEEALRVSIVSAVVFDYETTQSYAFNLTATGVTSGRSTVLPMTIDVLNVNEAPVFDPTEYAAEIYENSVASVLFTVSATDPDTLTSEDGFDANFGVFSYSLDGFRFETDANLFAVDPKTGVVSTTGSLNYEHRQEYTFQIVATDGGNAKGIADATVSVLNVNEAPTFIRLSNVYVVETAPVGTVIANVSTVDPDLDDSFTYTINKTGANSGQFVINENSELVLAKPLDPVHGKTQFSINIESMDAGGLSVELSFTIYVVNENDAPESIALYMVASAEDPVGLVALTTLAEDIKIDSIVGEFVVTDPDSGDYHNIVLLDDADGQFSVSGTFLILAKSLDFETTTTHTISVKAVDTGFPPMESPVFNFTFTVEDRPDAPKSIRFVPDVSVDENTVAGTRIGVITALDDDPNQPMEFTLAKDCPFTIGDVFCEVLEGGSGTVCSTEVVLSRQIDADTETASCEVTAESLDGLVTVSMVEIPVANVNEPPTDLILEPSQVSEGLAVGRTVGYLTVVDPDNTEGFTFTLLDGSSPRFGVAKVYQDAVPHDAVVVAAALDFESFPEETLVIRVTDVGGASAEFSITVTVTDQPMEMVISSSSIAEFVDAATSPDGTVVGEIELLHFDRTDLSVSWNLDTSDSPFAVVEGEGATAAQLVVADYSRLDYETVGFFKVSVTATFASTARRSVVPDPITGTFTISIEDSREGLSFVSEFAKPIVVPSDSPSGFIVARVEAIDKDASGRTIRYSIVDGNAAGAFKISSSSGRVSVAMTPDNTEVVMDSVLSLVVSANDGEASINTTVPVIVQKVAATTEDPNAVDFAESTKAGSTVTIAVAVVCGVVLLAAIVAVVLLVRRNSSNVSVYASGSFKPESATVPMSNPMYAAAQSGLPASNFLTGTANPLYAWYQPDRSREACVADLRAKRPGAFVVRDYKPTPGWHMLHVKTPSNTVFDAKIRYDQTAGLYDVLTSSTEPRFATVPELVNHYSTISRSSTLPCALTLDQDITTRQGLAIEEDVAAPALPLKDGQRTMIQQMAAGSDIYDNTAHARAALAGDTTI
eukprot:m.43833 g.43833  ORF g.43833 m.43833 type:complete len:1793 (+) comp10800_c0_seq1:242-5620(+)